MRKSTKKTSTTTRVSTGIYRNNTAGTYYVKRNGRYLGVHRTLKAAKNAYNTATGIPSWMI